MVDWLQDLATLSIHSTSTLISVRGHRVSILIN